MSDAILGCELPMSPLTGLITASRLNYLGLCQLTLAVLTATAAAFGLSIRAISLASWPAIRIPVHRALIAPQYTALSGGILAIIEGCPQKQMIGSDAASIVTSMKHIELPWLNPIGQPVDEPGSADSLGTELKPPISSSVNAGGPGPTAIRLADLRPEAFFDRQTRFSRNVHGGISFPLEVYHRSAARAREAGQPANPQVKAEDKGHLS